MEQNYSSQSSNNLKSQSRNPKSIQKKINKKIKELEEIKTKIKQIKNEINDLKTKNILIDMYFSKEVQIVIASIMTLISFSTFSPLIGTIVTLAGLSSQGLLALIGKIIKVKNKEKIEFLKMDKNVEIINKRECEQSINNYKSLLNSLEKNKESIYYPQAKDNQQNNTKEEIYIIQKEEVIRSHDIPKQYIKK